MTLRHEFSGLAAAGASPTRLSRAEGRGRGSRTFGLAVSAALALVSLCTVASAQAEAGLAWRTGPDDYLCLRSVYVAPRSPDAGSGTEADPWPSIAQALASGLKGGDCVVLEDGTYVETVWWQGVSGTEDSPTGYIALKARHPLGARLRPPPDAYSTLNISSSFVIVDGLDVVGGDGHAIDIEGAHHVMVLDSAAHDSGGSGISAWKGEFFRFEGNSVHGNAGRNGYQTSGISIYWARVVSDDLTTPGFRNVIRGNVSFGNRIGPAVTDPHTDGNGIIIDDFRQTQTTGVPAYPYPTLVDGNLVYGNGGKGIQVTWSDHVTVRNNTAWHDNLDDLNPGTWRGELSNAQSSHNVWVNNVAVEDPVANPDNTAFDDTSYGGYLNEDVTWRNNLGYATTPGGPLVRTDGGNAGPRPDDGNILGVDPDFLAPGYGMEADFRMAPGSPARDSGTAELGLAPKDLDGRPRIAGPAVDLGAYEH